MPSIVPASAQGATGTKLSAAVGKGPKVIIGSRGIPKRCVMMGNLAGHDKIAGLCFGR